MSKIILISLLWSKIVIEWLVEIGFCSFLEKNILFMLIHESFLRNGVIIPIINDIIRNFFVINVTPTAAVYKKKKKLC